MTTVDKIFSALPKADRSIIAGVQLERRFSLRDNSEDATLVIFTDRLLTAEGGDGHSGVDGGAIMCLRKAIQRVLLEEESAGMIGDVIIRQRDPSINLLDI